MFRCSNLYQYDWLETDDLGLDELIPKLLPSIIGTRAINTSFDSGVLGSPKMRLTSEEIALGWSIVNNRAISPILTETTLKSFLYTDAYDEWYFFKEIPDDFNAAALCNYMGMGLERIEEFNFEGGCDLLQALEKFEPVAVAGWNDIFSYYLIRNGQSNSEV